MKNTKSIFAKNPKLEKRLVELTGKLSQRKIAEKLSDEFKIKVGKSAVGRRQIKLGINCPEPQKTTAELVDEEKQKIVSDKEKAELKQLISEKAKLQIIIDDVREAVVPFKPQKVNWNLMRQRTSDEETAVLCLSDLHIGKKTTSYNSEIFIERLKKLQYHLALIINILRKTYPINNLVIFGLGDWVDHTEIYPTQKWHTDRDVMHQVFRTGVPTISTFLMAMSNMFKSVKLHLVRGNHGRDGKFVPEHQNFDLILYEVLQASNQALKNVEWDITWDWYTFAEVMGWKFLLTHGDLIKMWMNIPIYGQTQKGMRWQGSLDPLNPEEIKQEIIRVIKDKTPANERADRIVEITRQWSYLIMGHFHTYIWYKWNNFEVIGNPTFTSDDDYSLRTLGMRADTRQLLFGVHPKRGITWSYRIQLLK